MTNPQTTKRTLLRSIVSILVCFSMLLGTTYAWFTDSVTSGANIIATGNLNVELYHANAGTGGAEEKVDASTKLFTDVSSTLWEPGAMAWERFTVKNEGSLALKYEFALDVTNATEIGGISFAEMLKVAVVDKDFVYSSENVKRISADAWKDLDSLETLTSSTGLLADESDTFGIVIWWMPSANDNVFNMNNGQDVDFVSLNVRVVLKATQYTRESDSFGPDYDTDATYPPDTLHFAEIVTLTDQQVANGLLTQNITIGHNKYTNAVIPEGAQVNGAQLALKIDSMTASQANITLSDGAVAQSFDVRVEGMANNGKTAIITVYGMIPKGTSELKTDLYHVENGVTTAMTRVRTLAEVDAHNEFFYDSAKGALTMALASFSEVVTVINPVQEDEVLINEIVVTEVPSEAVSEDGTLKQEISISVAPPENSTAPEGETTAAPAPVVSAVVPQGVKLDESASTLTLDVITIPMEESQANIILEEKEVANSIDIHIEGIAADNEVPMLITLPALLKSGLNKSNLRLYHVENGETVEMTQVTLNELDAHNEFYYNPATGDVIVSMASFSSVITVTDDGHWNGVSDIEFAGGSGTAADPYLIANAGQLAYFRDIVDGIAPWDGDRSFKGQYIKLASNIFLNHEGEFNNLFDPIGWGYSYAPYNRNGDAGKVFKGTFDGNNYSIHGLWQNGWDLEATTGTDYTYTNCGAGLFACAENATFKNLSIIDATVTYECVEAGLLVGLAQGNCTFENIYVFNSKIANYQRPAGGIVGEISPSYTSDGTAIACTFNFKNIVLDTSVVVGSLWGDFDTPVGGVIGARWDDSDVSKVVMEDVGVACELDVYNDVTSTYQWYAYRRAGMLIGNTDTPPADGKNSKVATAHFLTCENVLVYYTNWVNYNYCQFSNYNSSWPWVRVQAGENCSAYSNPRYGVPNDANGNKVVDYSHTHAAGDQCNIQLFFNQLYGGGQGVYGQSEHPGVNTDVKYLITFIHQDHVGGIQFITEENEDPNGDGKHDVMFPDTANLPHLDQNVNYEWINRVGEVVDTNNESIPVGNRRDIFYYLTNSQKYYAHFVDKDGLQVARIEFDTNTGSFKNGGTEPAVPEVAGYYGIWEPYTLKGAEHDVIINAVYSKRESAEVLTTADELFKLLGLGHELSMSQDLSGGFGNASKNTFCTVVGDEPDIEGDTEARFDLNSFTLKYTGSSNANKDWTLFLIKSNCKLTVGSGLAGFGTLRFDFTSLNGNAKPTIFSLEKNATLVLERGVVVEMTYPSSNKEPSAFVGVGDLSQYPGITIERSAGLLRITVTARTVLTGK